MYKYRRYHPIFGNNQHGWFFTHMCGFYTTSEYIVDIWKKPHMCGFYQTLQKVCIVWKKTHMCGFYHGTMVFYHGTMVFHVLLNIGNLENMQHRV